MDGSAKALAMSEIIDFLPIPALVVSPTYRIVRASAGLVRTWGRKSDEFIGNDLFQALYQGSPTERFDRIPLIYAIETAVAARDIRLCYAAYVADGVSWTARITPVHRDDELLCFIFEWEKAETYTTVADGDIIQSWLPINEAFRLLVQAVKDYAIFLLDTRGSVMTWNKGAELMKGYKKEEIVGKHFSTFYGEEDIRSRKPERELEICLREGRVEDEGWRYRRDGSRFWANVVITAIYDKNGIHVGFGKVTRNLTERKEAELRLIAAYEESTKLKNDFLANISHEIRTPMHGMLSACSLLLDGALTEEQRETANIIEESGRILLQVINDILDYSKLVAGSFSIHNDKVDISSVVSSVVRSVQTTLTPGVSIKLNVAPDVPPLAQGDPLRCRQIADNIVGNAGKFTDEGTISVKVSLVDEDTTAYKILTEVVDTGHGVSEDAAQKLFKPFTQCDTTYQKRRQGTGLGLSIAKSLAELMDGDVGYKANPECEGSIFWFSVQLKKLKSLERVRTLDDHEKESREPSPHHALEHDAATQWSHLQQIAPKTRILAAEDNIINQKVLVGMLHAFGFKHVTVVSDGAQAVSALSNALHAFDLILMDISMPVMNGYEATMCLRERGVGLPIIAMTAYALKGDMERCLEKGLDDYIAKPVNRQLLMRLLLKWLEPQ
ncbi:hypothetical protein BGZ63DRAFT_427685 [Mariannaea sp. PMI_226]|nr:hypothetical protein BGZ63DRAFT_427685 [Mariannaea sp. PMI_226]